MDEKEKACETEKRKVDSCRVAKEKHEKEIGRVIKEKQKLEKAVGADVSGVKVCAAHIL